jgi:Predicted nucleotide-binding protein containing TIR-like domain
LAQLLDAAAFAFLIMTAEDERADGKLNARLNVVHEIGLFQGRRGFNRAIILLEEGCEEFSNIHGLGHIPFSSVSAMASRRSGAFWNARSWCPRSPMKKRPGKSTRNCGIIVD